MRINSLLTLALLLAPSVALAQDPSVQAAAPTTDPLAKENWPLSYVDRPIGLSAGMLQVDVWSATALTKGAAGKPISFPLGILYGVTNELQLGLVHGVGVCVTGSSCSKAYDDAALQAIFSITGRGSSFELAAWTQLNYLSFDKGTMNLFVGPYINWVIGGNVAILSNPGIAFGLTKRDTGNKELVNVPVYAYFRAGEKVAPVLYTGISGPLSGFGDAFAVPLGVGAIVGINTVLDVVARFDLTNALGKRGDGVGFADGRALTLGISLRPL